MAVFQKSDAVIACLVRTCDQSIRFRKDFLHKKNASGQTALDLAWSLGLKRAAWTIIQCGRMSDYLKKTKINILEAVPSDAQGDSPLHIYARSNYASEIKKYSEESDSGFVKACLMTNRAGNLPATEAARYARKEALLALLQPFLVFPSMEELDTLLHHRNKEGHRLLLYVSHHKETLSVVHGILIELENIVHDQDAFRVKECLRTTLGSTQAAKFSTDQFQKIQHNQSGVVSSSLVFLRTLSLTFLLRTAAVILDMCSDGLLLHQYYQDWDEEEVESKSAVFFPGTVERSKDPCTGVISQERGGQSFLGHGPAAYGNITLKCYAGAISSEHRFYLTSGIVLMPFILYFFELLRFRTLSKCLDKYLADGKNHFLIRIFKPFGNFCLWLTWPLVAFFRHFWFSYKLDTSEGERKIRRYKSSVRTSMVISSRAQLIEVCTEASLQPMLQLYLVFQELVAFDIYNLNLQEALNVYYDINRRQIFSVIISLITLSWAYTAQYRQNKENSIDLLPSSLVYFVSIGLLVVARILCFEMFAYYLGPGNLEYAFIAAGCHALFMAFLHFVFSDSWSQCSRSKCQSKIRWVRQILLVLLNCLLNGMANIYVHNNLEKKSFDRKSLKYDDAHNAAFDITTDERQRTFVRQVIFDLVFFVENALMMYLARFTATKTPNFSDIYSGILIVVSVTYFIGTLLKVVFYMWCHPWSELIRPRRLGEFETSFTVLSTTREVSVSPTSFTIHKLIPKTSIPSSSTTLAAMPRQVEDTERSSKDPVEV